jgi:hypothetical protein
VIEFNTGAAHTLRHPPNTLHVKLTCQVSGSHCQCSLQYAGLPFNNKAPSTCSRLIPAAGQQNHKQAEIMIIMTISLKIDLLGYMTALALQGVHDQQQAPIQATASTPGSKLYAASVLLATRQVSQAQHSAGRTCNSPVVAATRHDITTMGHAKRCTLGSPHDRLLQYEVQSKTVCCSCNELDLKLHHTCNSQTVCAMVLQVHAGGCMLSLCTLPA